MPAVRRRVLVGLGTLGAAIAVVAPPVGPSPAAAVTTSAFVPVAPCRVLDTRAEGPGLAAGHTRTVAVAGTCGTHPDAVAVVVTLTVVGPDGPGHLSAWSAGTPWPGTSVSNFASGEIVAMSTVVAVGAGGAIDVRADRTTELVVDVTGSFVAAASATAGRFLPAPPVRLVDTRASGRPAAGAAIRVALPPELAGASAVAVNVTTDDSRGPGFFSAYPAGSAPPVASALNTDAPGQTRAAFAIVPVSADGFDVLTSAGDHVLVDLLGTFTGPNAPASSDGLYVPDPAPIRRLDTRTGPDPRVLLPGRAVEVAVGQGAAALGTITIVGATEAGYFTAYPAGTGRPATSSVNVTDYWQTRANSALTPLTTRGLAIAASHGGHVVYDEVGWFTGSPAAAHGPVEYNDPAGTLPYPVTPCDTIVGPGGSSPGMDGLAAGSTTMPSSFVRFGTSVEGRPLYAEYWGPARPDHVVLVVGLVHGNECAPQRLTRAFRAEPPAGSYGAWVIPVLNPDGAVAMRRTNAHDVDLNKDGARVAEPETAALMELTRRLRPDVSVHVHAPNGMVGWYGAGAYHGNDPGASGAHRSGPIAQRIARETARVAAPGLRLAGAGQRSDRGIWFLWQGQREVVPGHESVLVELYAVADGEVPIATPRPPTQGVAAADAHAHAILAALDHVL